MGLGIGIGTELAIENGIGSQQGRLSGASMGLNIENSMGFTTDIISFSPMHNYRADWYAGRDDPEVGQDDQGHRGKNRHQACHKASFEAVAEHAHRQRDSHDDEHDCADPQRESWLGSACEESAFARRILTHLNATFACRSTWRLEY